MTTAVDGLRAERDSVLTIAKSFTAEDWNAPSDCAGWTVRDVFAHMGSVLHGVVDPAFMPDMSSGGTENAMEAPVAERRGWNVEDVLAEYETYSAQVADFCAMAQEPPMADTELPMGDLGTHPMRVMAGMFLFDAYCHLRNDILQPHGPIDRDEPPRDEMRLGPVIEWMLAGLPWMSRDALLPIVDRPLDLVLDGPGGGSWTIAPGGPDGRVLVSPGVEPNAAATVRSTAHDFVIWATTRRPWRGLATVEGDEAYAARVLDAVNVF